MFPTLEVKCLVASFLLEPDDLLDAQVFHPDAWHDTQPEDWYMQQLLERAPIAACRMLFHEFDRAYPDSVAYWKGQRGFDIAHTTPKAPAPAATCKASRT